MPSTRSGRARIGCKAAQMVHTHLSRGLGSCWLQCLGNLSPQRCAPIFARLVQLSWKRDLVHRRDFLSFFCKAVVVERLPSSLPERCIYSIAPGRNRHSSLSISWLCSRPTLDHVSRGKHIERVGLEVQPGARWSQIHK